MNDAKPANLERCRDSVIVAGERAICTLPAHHGAHHVFMWDTEWALREAREQIAALTTAQQFLNLTLEKAGQIQAAQYDLLVFLRTWFRDERDDITRNDIDQRLDDFFRPKND